jgi:hypothetical protein
MTRKVAAALVVGLLIGLLIGTLLPAQARGRPSADRLSLERRVARLEHRTKYLSLGGNIGPDHVRTASCSSSRGLGSPSLSRASATRRV